MAFRFWRLLVLIQQAGSMGNSVDRGPITLSLFDSSPDFHGNWDPHYDPLELRLSLTGPSDQKTHSSGRAALQQYEPEALITHHDQLDHGHLRHNPPQLSLGHDDQSENSLMPTRIGVELSQDAHSPPRFLSMIKQPVHGSQLPGSTYNTGTSLYNDSPLPLILRSSSLVRPVVFHPAEGSSKRAERGHPLFPKVIKPHSDGLDTNHHLIQANAEDKPPTVKRKFNAEGTESVSSERDAKKLSSIQNVHSYHLNPESALRIHHIPHIFPQSLVQRNYNFKYQLIDFEPLTIDGEIVIEAITRLKLPNGTKFFNIPISYNPSIVCSQNQDQTKTGENKKVDKLFCLYPSDEDSNSFEFYQFFHTFKFHKEYDGVSISTHTKKIMREYEIRAAWKNFGPIGSAPQKSMISSYEIFVLRDFAELVSDFNHKIELRFRNGDYQKKSKIFEIFNKLFTRYLLYVDMINAIAPIGKVDRGGEFLRSPRKEAGGMFFEVLSQVFFDEHKEPKPQDRKSEIIFELIEIMKERPYRLLRQFGAVWKFLEFWILTKRNDLICKSRTSVNKKFKEFYNCMVFKLLNQP